MAHEGWLGELWVAWLLPCGRAALRFASALALAVVLTLRIPSVSRTYACMHAYIHACIHTCMLTCSHAHAAHPECEQPCTLHTYVCVHVYIHTYMHTCIHAHVCTQVSSLSAWDVVLASYAAAIAEAAATQVCMYVCMYVCIHTYFVSAFLPRTEPPTSCFLLPAAH